MSIGSVFIKRRQRRISSSSTACNFCPDDDGWNKSELRRVCRVRLVSDLTCDCLFEFLRRPHRVINFLESVFYGTSFNRIRNIVSQRNRLESWVLVDHRFLDVSRHCPAGNAFNTVVDKITAVTKDNKRFSLMKATIVHLQEIRQGEANSA